MNSFLHDLKWLGEFCHNNSIDGVLWKAQVDLTGIKISVKISTEIGNGDTTIISFNTIVTWTDLSYYNGNIFEKEVQRMASILALSL